MIDIMESVFCGSCKSPPARASCPAYLSHTCVMSYKCNTNTVSAGACLAGGDMLDRRRPYCTSAGLHLHSAGHAIPMRCQGSDVV